MKQYAPNTQKIYALCSLSAFARVFRGHFTLAASRNRRVNDYLRFIPYQMSIDKQNAA
jgi:hypothetical protein